MNPIDYIVSYCNSISSFFYSIYLEVNSWIYPFWLAGAFFYNLSTLFADVAWSFYYFSQWVDDVTTKVVNLLSWSTIQSYILNWLPNLDDINQWFYDWRYWIENAVGDWWYYIQDTVQTWLNDAENWTIAQLNSVRSWVLTLMSDAEAWTQAQLNSLSNTFNTLIADVEQWTTTQFNTAVAFFVATLANLKEATLTLINQAKSSILAIISDLTLWTQTEFNNIKEMIGAALPWEDILAFIISWGAIPATAIEDLINSTLQSWFPFYNDLVELWDSIVGFFTDPWQFLYDRVEELFDRFW